MKVFRVAVNSSCLIGLAQIEKFGLLKEVFAETYVPRAVYEEVVVKGRLIGMKYMQDKNEDLTSIVCAGKQQALKH